MMKKYRAQGFLRTILSAFLYITTVLVQASTHVSFKGKSLSADSHPDPCAMLQPLSHPLLYRDQYIVAVNRNGLALQYIPEQAIDRNICLTAVAQNGKALEFVPNAFKVKSVCRTAILENRAALEWVPKEFQPWAFQLLVLEQIRAHRVRQLGSLRHGVIADASEAGMSSESLKKAILFASLLQLYAAQYH